MSTAAREGGVTESAFVECVVDSIWAARTMCPRWMYIALGSPLQFNLPAVKKDLSIKLILSVQGLMLCGNSRKSEMIAREASAVRDGFRFQEIFRLRMCEKQRYLQATWVDSRGLQEPSRCDLSWLSAPRFLVSTSTCIEITMELWKGKYRASSHCDSRARADAGALLLSANNPIKRTRRGEPKIELLFVPSMPDACCDEWCCRAACASLRWCALCGRSNCFGLGHVSATVCAEDGGGYVSHLIGTCFARVLVPFVLSLLPLPATSVTQKAIFHFTVGRSPNTRSVLAVSRFRYGTWTSTCHPLLLLCR